MSAARSTTPVEFVSMVAAQKVLAICKGVSGKSGPRCHGGSGAYAFPSREAL